MCLSNVFFLGPHWHAYKNTKRSLDHSLRTDTAGCCNNHDKPHETLHRRLEIFLLALPQNSLVCVLKLVVTEAHIRRSSDRYMGSALSRWWAAFLPGPERANCEGALCEEEGSSCRQLNRCSVGSPLDTVIACLLKAGQWGLSLAEEFCSTRQHVNTHSGTSAALQPSSLLLWWERKWMLGKPEVKDGCHKKLVYGFNSSLDEMVTCYSKKIYPL